MWCVAAGIAAKQNYTDADIVNFLTNVECLEGQFDTFGAFGFGFVGEFQASLLHQLPLAADCCCSSCIEFVQSYVQSYMSESSAYVLSVLHPYVLCKSGTLVFFVAHGQAHGNESPDFCVMLSNGDDAGNLNMGGPAPIGAQKANLSDAVEPYMQEVALSEQVSASAGQL